MCIKAVPFAVGPKSISRFLSMYFFLPHCRLTCPHCGESLPETRAFTLHHPTPVQAAQTPLLLPILSQTPPTCPALPLAHLPPTAIMHHCHSCFILCMSWGIGGGGGGVAVVVVFTVFFHTHQFYQTEFKIFYSLVHRLGLKGRCCYFLAP